MILYGFGLGPAQLTQFQINSAGRIDTQLAGASVSFNGTFAPILYASATQVAAIVPYAVPGTSARVVVTYQGKSSTEISVPVVSSAPGIFTLDSTGKGQAAAVNQDGSINSAGHPAPPGSVVLLFATGEGQTSPTVVDGQPAQTVLPRPLLPVTVTIGGQTAQILHAGGAPGATAGLMQINAVIPAGLATTAASAVPVVLTVGNNSSQAGVTITVRN